MLDALELGLMTGMFLRYIVSACLAVFLSFYQLLAYASDNLAGQVVFAVGDAYIVGPSGPTLAKSGAEVIIGDRLVTGPKGYMHLRMADGAFIGIRSESLLVIDDYQFDVSAPQDGRVKLHLQDGTVRAISGRIAQHNKQNFRLNTPIAAIGVRGTDFVVASDHTNTYVSVAEGGIALAPYSSDCRWDQLGACSGAGVMDLYASQPNSYLAISDGESVPVLRNAFKYSLFAPAHPREHVDSLASQTVTSNTKVTRSSVDMPPLRYVQSTPVEGHDWYTGDLADLLSSDGAEQVRELVQFDSIEFMRVANDDQLPDVYRQKLDRKIVDIANLHFEILQSEPSLHRFYDETGMIAWGNLEQSRLFDERVQQLSEKLGYAELMQRAGIPNYLQSYGMGAQQATNSVQAWHQYYANGSLQPITSVGDSSLYYADGLAPLRMPTLNYIAPQASLDFGQVSVFNGDGHNLSDSYKVDISINYAKHEFEVDVHYASPDMDWQTLIFKGSFNASGMLFGGSDMAYVEGMFINATQQLALLLHHQVDGADGNTMTVMADDISILANSASTGVQAKLYQANDEAQITWGRWENFQPLTDTAVAQLDIATKAISAQNSHFVLFKPANSVSRLPEQGVYGFKLNDYEAIYENDIGIYTSELSNASLRIDFAQSTFNTSMSATSSGFDGCVELVAAGGIDALGQFDTQSTLSNMSAQGFVGDSGLSAGMLINHGFEDGSELVGALDWQAIPN